MLRLCLELWPKPKCEMQEVVRAPSAPPSCAPAYSIASNCHVFCNFYFVLYNLCISKQVVWKGHEGKLPARIGNYDRKYDSPTDNPTERRTDRFIGREVSLSKSIFPLSLEPIIYLFGGYPPDLWRRKTETQILYF